MEMLACRSNFSIFCKSQPVLCASTVAQVALLACLSPLSPSLSRFTRAGAASMNYTNKFLYSIDLPHISVCAHVKRSNCHWTLFNMKQLWNVLYNCACLLLWLLFLFALPFSLLRTCSPFFSHPQHTSIHIPLCAVAPLSLTYSIAYQRKRPINPLRWKCMWESAHMFDIFNSKWNRTTEKSIEQSGKSASILSSAKNP